MITLHQAAFMLDTQTYQATVADHCRESPLYARLSGSEKILVNSARKMANLQLDLFDKHLESRLFTASQSLFVVLILSLNIIKYPNERRIYSDLEASIPILLYVVHFLYPYSSLNQPQNMPRTRTPFQDNILNSSKVRQLSNFNKKWIARSI
jgi:hypothetical protein